MTKELLNILSRKARREYFTKLRALYAEIDKELSKNPDPVPGQSAKNIIRAFGWDQILKKQIIKKYEITV